MVKVGDKVRGIGPFADHGTWIKSGVIYTVLRVAATDENWPEMWLDDKSGQSWLLLPNHFEIVSQNHKASKHQKLGVAEKIAADRTTAHRKAVKEAGLDWAFKQKRAGFLCSARNAVMGEAIDRAVVVDRKLGLRR